MLGSRDPLIGIVRDWGSTPSLERGVRNLKSFELIRSVKIVPPDAHNKLFGSAGRPKRKHRRKAWGNCESMIVRDETIFGFSPLFVNTSIFTSWAMSDAAFSS